MEVLETLYQRWKCSGTTFSDSVIAALWSGVASLYIRHRYNHVHQSSETRAKTEMASRSGFVFVYSGDELKWMSSNKRLSL